MAVVINDFEVVAETPPPAANTQAAETPPAPQLTPHDIERMVRHRIERQARLSAH